MLTECRSYGDGCPCLDCNKSCCVDFDIVDTEKLCEKARVHCEKCALEYESEVNE